MKINEDKWTSIGSIQDFVNDKSQKVVDPYFDWFISSLVTNLNSYNLSQYTKSNLISFVYLLLNTQFQTAVRKIRNSLDIPENGFTDLDTYYKWRNDFFQAVNNYQKAKKIPLKQNKIITFIEKQTIKIFKGKVSISTIFQNPEDILAIVIIKLLKIGKDRNLKLWSSFFYHLIFTFNPKELLDNLHGFDIQDNEFSISEDYFSGSVNLTIPLSLNSTINSIRTTIEKNKTKILQTIEEMKVKSPKTDLEAFEIKRDYFIYNVYTSHKSPRKHMEETWENVRKEMAVADKAEELLSEKEYEGIDKLKWKSMRKIVSKMKQRIKQSFIDKSDGIGNLLTAIELTEPAPYPEFVADRLITHRHPPKK